MKRARWLLLPITLLLAGTPNVASALPFLFVDNQATADAFASVADKVDDPGPAVSTNRIVAAVSVATAVNGPDLPVPAENGVATATAVTVVVAPSPTNKVTIRSSLGMGIGAREPFVATALAESYGHLTLAIGPDNILSLGDPMFVELKFLAATSVFDPAIAGSRSYRVLNQTLGTTLFDSAAQGFPSTTQFFSARVGDEIRVEYALSMSGSLSGPPGTDRQDGDMVLRSTLRAVAIPEPASALLLGIGVAGLTLARGRTGRDHA